MLKINGVNIQKGDCLGFVSEVHQHGEVITIQDVWVTLKALNSDGYQGCVIGGKHTATVHISDTWLLNNTCIVSG